MQKLVGAFLLICFTAPAVSSYLWLRYERNQVRHEVKEMILQGLDEKDLVVFTFTNLEKNRLLYWEHELEFVFKGQKYDVVSIRKEHNSNRYVCWKDVKESKIESQISKLVEDVWGNDQSQKERHQHVLMSVKDLPIAYSYSFSVVDVDDFPSRCDYYYHNVPLINFTNPVAPPPRMNA